MSVDENFQKIKNFLEINPASQKLSALLPENAEISIKIGEGLECVYFRHNNKPFVERRSSKNEVVTLNFLPEGIDLLTSSRPEEATDIISDFFKIYLSGLVKIKVHGSLELFQSQLATVLSKLPSRDDLKMMTQLILKKFSQK